MQLGEPDIVLGDHATLGPMRIEIFQPSPTPVAAEDSTFDLLHTLITEVRTTNLLLHSIHTYLTRLPWWKRAWERIKHVAFSR